MFRVDSEVGRLRQVILHRPGLELKRLTPENAADLLFDDVLWVSEAQAEHDVFASVLRERGIEVHYYRDLLAQTLAIGEARGYVMDRVFDPRLHGPLAVDALRGALEDLDAESLAEFLIGGITKREILELAPEPRSIAFHSLDMDGFVLAPLPNVLYQRDNSCWIYGGVSINAMRRRARRPETILGEALYRWHPMFARGGFEVWLHGAQSAPATIEGGDILVLGNGAVLAGMSERSQPQAIEMLAHRLFSAGAANRLVAINMPKARAFMHLDTVLTMIDTTTFVRYPDLDPRSLRTWLITPADPEEVSEHDTGGLHVEPRDDLFVTIADALGVEKVVVLAADEDSRAAEREQWDDANNFLAVAPGVVIGYERNTVTNRMLEQHGIKVLPIPGSELGRARGGSRCMTCPIQRDGI